MLLKNKALLLITLLFSGNQIFAKLLNGEQIHALLAFSELAYTCHVTIDQKKTVIAQLLIKSDATAADFEKIEEGDLKNAIIKALSPEQINTVYGSYFSINIIEVLKKDSSTPIDEELAAILTAFQLQQEKIEARAQARYAAESKDAPAFKVAVEEAKKAIYAFKELAAAYYIKHADEVQS